MLYYVSGLSCLMHRENSGADAAEEGAADSPGVDAELEAFIAWAAARSEDGELRFPEEDGAAALEDTTAQLLEPGILRARPHPA